MRAVWLVLAAGFRRQWRSWVLLGLLIAVASGFVLASTAAGRRTDSAFPRYIASHGYDAIVYTVKPLPEFIVHDFPAGGWRFKEPAAGIYATFVNGRMLMKEGAHTGNREYIELAWPPL